jgi:DNA-binding PadR family transcriptional regulator
LFPLMAEIGTLGHALLGLLAERPCSGYELTRHFDRSLANVWPAKHSQIYPELAKLQAAGWIRHSESGARGSKTYAATDAGVAEVRRWMRETQPADGARSERMLRVFFLWLLDEPDAAGYLADEAARHRERLEHFRGVAARIPAAGDRADRMSRIALEAGIRFEAMMAEWATWASAQLDVPEHAQQPRA